VRASTSTPTSLGENAESSGKRQPSAIDRIGQAWAEAAIAPRAAHSAHRSHAPCPMRAGRGENPSGRTCAEPSRFSKTPRRTNKQITQTDPQTRKQTRSAFRFVSDAHNAARPSEQPPAAARRGTNATHAPMESTHRMYLPRSRWRQEGYREWISRVVANTLFITTKRTARPDTQHGWALWSSDAMLSNAYVRRAALRAHLIATTLTAPGAQPSAWLPLGTRKRSCEG
jgi:hypothetical protein